MELNPDDPLTLKMELLMRLQKQDYVAAAALTQAIEKKTKTKKYAKYADVLDYEANWQAEERRELSKQPE